MWPAILDYYGIDLANLTYVLFFLVLHEYVRDFWSEQVLFTSDFAGSIIAMSMDSCMWKESRPAKSHDLIVRLTIFDAFSRLSPQISRFSELMKSSKSATSTGWRKKKLTCLIYFNLKTKRAITPKLHALHSVLSNLNFDIRPVQFRAIL